MLHIFLQYIALFLAEDIIKGEKVLPEADVTETFALSLCIPFNGQVFGRVCGLYNTILEHRSPALKTWLLSRVVGEQYLDTFRNACIQTYNTNMQISAWDEQWEGY